ncbi:MAG TPA: serine/threonine-protein kinase [Candidatus Saccharimonadales bacterium]|nr:serine/threonine-protein kinase [Candidatus Saccharimonadales bacterium]
MTERPSTTNAKRKVPLWMSLVGGALAILACFWFADTETGAKLERSSYDYLLRFGYPPVTNKVVLIQMDNASYEHLGQVRGTNWSRMLHVRLLEKLAAEGCPLVVMDTHFRDLLEPQSDGALAQALHKQRRVVIMAKQIEDKSLKAKEVRPLLPQQIFLEPGITNWGVAFLVPDEDGIVRQHWPASSPSPHPSLPWTAAVFAGATLGEDPQERWLRYYGEEGCWERISYHFALSNAPGYFRDKVVFIGNKPATPIADGEKDEFQTPYAHWGADTVGGVEILITEFLNLMNHDWLRRLPHWVEIILLCLTGLGLGGGLCRVRPVYAVIWSVGLGIFLVLAAAIFSYAGNVWFPWLFIAAFQMPVALTWSIAVPKAYGREKPLVKVEEGRTVVVADVDVPRAPDYEVFQPAFAEGAYGKVWLVRNAVGEWQALKAIYRKRFKENPEPFEREFRGITCYKPFSNDHPGLLRVDFVSTKKQDEYFYYVMELGDSRVKGWEAKPETYKPLDLAAVQDATERKRLPARDCVRIGLQLAEALEFLHSKGLTHRDIKPQNIIFVQGRPKLADVGLVTEAEVGRPHSFVGTPGFMPLPPEHPGTIAADLYALGMVLYVISTGRAPALFPELSTTLLNETDPVDFMRLNPIIIKACHPDLNQRYSASSVMVSELRKLDKILQENAS